ncbi:MAG: hypothetical protein E4G94_01890 [ANME-2 cluster archaeon]|nr:MAG: hypothetical protein E4G94_01890 [ANME-2 cluster archaeon]
MPKNSRKTPVIFSHVTADAVTWSMLMKYCSMKVSRSVSSNLTAPTKSHGANCELCYIIANNAADMLDDGKTLIETRNVIDREYQGKGRTGTKTPMPPEGNK